jgi:hypothetical protein
MNLSYCQVKTSCFIHAEFYRFSLGKFENRATKAFREFPGGEAPDQDLFAREIAWLGFDAAQEVDTWCGGRRRHNAADFDCLAGSRNIHACLAFFSKLQWGSFSSFQPQVRAWQIAKPQFFFRPIGQALVQGHHFNSLLSLSDGKK